MLDLRICRSPMSLAARLVHLRVGNQWWPPTGEGAGVGGTSVNAQTSALPPDRLERRVDPSENKTVGAIAHIRPETLAKLDKTLLRRARYLTFLCLLRAGPGYYGGPTLVRMATRQTAVAARPSETAQGLRNRSQHDTREWRRNAEGVQARFL